MKRLSLLQIVSATVISFDLFFSNARAATGRMVCDNPRRSYAVKFDDEFGAFSLSVPEGNTQYNVKSVSLQRRGAIFKGDTTKGGPTFEAYTYGRKRIEFFIDNKRIQTDFCH